jgi:hypothetical protein
LFGEGDFGLARAEFVKQARLELQSGLGGDEIFAFLRRVLAAEAVLQFSLQVIGEAIAEGGVDPPNVVAPFGPVISWSDRSVPTLTRCATPPWG